MGIIVCKLVCASVSVWGLLFALCIQLFMLCHMTL